jgi:hypothetical protein
MRIYIVMAVILAANIMSASTIYVRYNASGLNNGTSWNDAFILLQSALDTAVPGDEIWVSKGIYKPTFDYGLGLGIRGNHFRLKNEVSVYGGFAGFELLLTQRNVNLNVTILSGNIGLPEISNDNCYHVFYHPNGSNLNNTAVLDGFTVRGGFADGPAEHSNGAGIFNDYSDPAIKNCTIVNNIAAGSGGAFYNYYSSPDIFSSRIGNNSASTGGGFFNTFSADLKISNSLIYNNTAIINGGSSFNDNSNVTSTNCTTILKSGAKGKAHTSSGPYSQSVSNLKDYACVSWHEETDSITVFIDATSTMEMNYCCYSFAEGELVDESGTGFIEGAGNVHSDPLFADSGNEDYRLIRISPCVDAGNDSYTEAMYDIRGEGYPRKLDKEGNPGPVDIGAYEYNKNYDQTIILPPENVTVFISADSTQLSWNEVSGASSYNIFRSADPYSGYVLIGNTSELYYADESAATADKYFYYVTAESAK